MLNLDQAKMLTTIYLTKTIMTMSLLREFSDDHIPCAVAKLNGVEFDLWWCGGHVVVALEISDSEQAKEIVFGAVVSNVHTSFAELFEETDEELRKMIDANRDVYDVVLTCIKGLNRDDSLYKEMHDMFTKHPSTVIDSNFNIL